MLARNPSRESIASMEKTRGAQEELFTLVINAKLQKLTKI
jgi:hypothetical protein